MSTNSDPIISSPLPAPFSTGTGLVDAEQNQLESSRIMAGRLNDSLKSIYLTGFNNWKINVDSGRWPNTNPPLPPMAYEVSKPDALGFQWPVIGNTPVCEMPPLPEDHFTPIVKVPNTIDIGRNIGGSWFSVGPHDTFPAGKTTPPIADVDGTPHTYEKFAAPVGAGWYLQLS